MLGGNPDFADSDARLHFVEQLHEIGRTLSYVHRDHERAADLFRIALRFDASHSYSHHYLAFNLDWLATSSEDIETHYQEAIRLQPDHPWWRSRWISYLATRRRFQDARGAWRDAMSEISVSETGSSREWLCRSLHRWVARWLLHWGELDFAEEVLRSVPKEMTTTDASIQALWELLAALREAQSETAVFPLNVPAKERWSSGPHTNLPLRWQDKQLLSWQPARVESVDAEEQTVFLLAARRPESRGSEPEYESIELTQSEVESIAYDFGWRDLGEGKFVEFGYYGQDNLRKMGLHRVVEWRDPRLASSGASARSLVSPRGHRGVDLQGGGSLMALPDRLHDELLYLFVFGPGSAETVLVRVPPDQWLIINSFVSPGDRRRNLSSPGTGEKLRRSF